MLKTILPKTPKKANICIDSVSRASRPSLARDCDLHGMTKSGSSKHVFLFHN